MTNSDRKQFAQLCALLSQAFDKEMSTLLANIYFDSLKDFSIEQVACAVEQAIKSRKFFPKVAELRELIEGGADDRAAQAWALFLEAVSNGGQSSVQFSDRAMATAMDAVFGGWTQACGILSANCSDEMVAHYQKAFLKQYASAKNSGREALLYRPGLTEMNLREGGAAWAARMPTLHQPVIYVGSERIITLRLPFDVERGQLAAEARAMLDKEPLVKAFADTQGRQLRVGVQEALLPSPHDDEPATPEQVAQINASIQLLASKR